MLQFYNNYEQRIDTVSTTRSKGQSVTYEINMKHYVCIQVEWSNLTIESIIIHDLKY